MPLNPSAAATSATIKNVSAQLSIVFLSVLLGDRSVSFGRVYETYAPQATDGLLRLSPEGLRKMLARSDFRRGFFQHGLQLIRAEWFDEMMAISRRQALFLVGAHAIAAHRDAEGHAAGFLDPAH